MHIDHIAKGSGAEGCDESGKLTQSFPGGVSRPLETGLGTQNGAWIGQDDSMWTEPDTKVIKLCERIGEESEVPAVGGWSLPTIPPYANPTSLSHHLLAILSLCLRDVPKAMFLTNEEELSCVSVFYRPSWRTRTWGTPWAAWKPFFRSMMTLRRPSPPRRRRSQ